MCSVVQDILLTENTDTICEDSLSKELLKCVLQEINKSMKVNVIFALVTTVMPWVSNTMQLIVLFLCTLMFIVSMNNYMRSIYKFSDKNLLKCRSALTWCLNRVQYYVWLNSTTLILFNVIIFVISVLCRVNNVGRFSVTCISAAFIMCMLTIIDNVNEHVYSNDFSCFDDIPIKYNESGFGALNINGHEVSFNKNLVTINTVFNSFLIITSKEDSSIQIVDVSDKKQ